MSNVDVLRQSVTISPGADTTLRPAAAMDYEGAGGKVFWTFKWIIQPGARVATNMLVCAVWAAIVGFLIGPFTGQNVFTSAQTGFQNGFAFTFTVAGGIIAIVFGILGAVHGWKMASAGTYDGVGGFFSWLLDNTWSLPNSMVASLWATITVGIESDSSSEGSGNLYLKNGVFGSYDTTFGNVIAGVKVPRHEFVHVIQARIVGPFFYPIFAANYALNLIPYWWILKAIIGWPKKPITGFVEYFTLGVYPYTIFEAIAYAVQGEPQ